MLLEEQEIETASCDHNQSSTLSRLANVSPAEEISTRVNSNENDDASESRPLHDQVQASDTEPSSLSAVESSMLERLSKDAEVIVKSQQRGEPDLSAEEKLDAIKELYCCAPVQFLSRFGKHLVPGDSICFEKFRIKDNDEITVHLKEIEKWNKGSQGKLLKNRRYEALKKLVETTDYFSEEEMQRRNPILYEQLIGKYHTEEEREAFLQASWKSASGSGTTTTPLTDLFLAHLDRNSDGVSFRRLAQESQLDEEHEADAEYDSEEMDCDDASSEPGPSRKNERSPNRRPTVNEEPAREEIDDEEKELLKEEFFTTMYRHFLNGKDEDFDYSSVDNNPDYDCGENLNNDEEEKYFDEEEPCEVSEPNSEQGELFRPRVRSSEIETKIGELSVNHSSSQNDEVKTEDNTASSDEEDELDKYMKEIEKQLHK